MAAAPTEIVIKAGSRKAIDLSELWRFRELFYFFTWRDIKVRYRQTVMGAGWAIIQPFATMVIFTVFFHNVAGIQSGTVGVPYAIFAYSGLLYWNYFSSAVALISGSLVGAQGVITKVYFPRIIPPVASSLLGVVDFFFAFVIFVGMMFYYQITPTVLGVVLIIPMLLLSVLFALALGILFAALMVRFRDIRTALPFVIQLMLFVTPVIYPIKLFPHRFEWLVNLNPMASVVTTMRASLIGAGSIPWGGLGLACLSSSATLAIALIYFSKAEKTFADIV